MFIIQIMQSHALQSKVYFVKTGEGKYITVFTHHNPLTKKMEAQIANELDGTPPPEMPEMDMKTFNLVRNKKINGMQDLRIKK